MMDPKVETKDRYQVNTLLDLWGAYLSIRNDYAHWWRVSAPNRYEQQHRHMVERKELKRISNKHMGSIPANYMPQYPMFHGTVPVTGEGLPLMNMDVNDKQFENSDDDADSRGWAPGKPREFGDAFPGFNAREADFNVTAPICLPDPIFQNVPEGMKNPSGEDFLENRVGLGVSGSMYYSRKEMLTPGMGILGYGFNMIWNSDFNPVVKHPDGEKYTLYEKYDAALDAMARRPFPLQRYVESLVSMSDEDFITGSAMKHVVMPGVGETTSDLKAEETHLLEQISYLGVLLQARHDLEFIIEACNGRENLIVNYHRTPRNFAYSLDPINQFVAGMDKPTGFDDMSSVDERSVTWAVNRSGSFDWLVGLVSDVRNFVNGLEEPPIGDAPEPETDEPPAEDRYYTRKLAPKETHFKQYKKEKNRDEINRLKHLALEMMLTQLERLTDAIDERVNAEMAQPFYLEYTPSRMKYVGAAEISVWPYTVDDEGERVYIFNPIPPIVENVLLPTCTMGTWKYRTFGASTN